MSDPVRDAPDAALADLAHDLPADVPDAARREAVRSSLLAAATAEREAPRPRWRLIGAGFAAGALAAAAVAVLVVRSRPSSTPVASRDRDVAMPPTAHIDAPADASFERELVHDGSGHLGELVRVHAGALHVAAAHPGQHVQLATADARVDGDGEVEVDVAADQLRAVTVRTGTATLRVRDQQVVVLAAGQTWKAPVITAQVVPQADAAAVPPSAPPRAEPPTQVERSAPTHVDRSAPAHVETTAHADAPVRADRAPAQAALAEPTAAPLATDAPAPPAPAAATTPAPASTTVDEPPHTTDTAAGSAAHQPSATEQHFAAGWTLLKQGKAADAARELGAAADGDGDPALAADARYFQAVAWIRAGRKTEAEHALVAFLDHAPHSLRRGRAAVMLGKLIAERGDAKSARAWFESALADPDPAVVAAARAGIAAL